MIDPVNLDLGLCNEAWAKLFSARSLEESSLLYKDIHKDSSLTSDSLLVVDCCSTRHHFDGVSTDVIGVFTAKSPLDQLQLLTSAFRKATATLSNLKLKPLLQHSTTEQGEMDKCP